MAPTSHRKIQRSQSARNFRQSSIRKLPLFDLPYFAHQQLDPDRYNLSVGLPIAKPGWAPAPKEIATATNGGWGDDADAPLNEDPDADPSIHSDVESPKPSVCKRRRSGEQDTNPYKRLKVAGGRPAVAKKVTADLDSDDELIVRMKNAKYLEKDIAQRLIDEGRTAYHPKTIGTRWARLKKVLERRQDELLDAELTDWHEGDDDVLEEAVRRADEIVTKAKADADNRKWKIVAEVVKTMKPVLSFSQNACRSRYADLKAGTAKPVPESIANPNNDILRSIRSRLEKEALINEDKTMLVTSRVGQDNIEGNAWTSKRRKYF